MMVAAQVLHRCGWEESDHAARHAAECAQQTCLQRLLGVLSWACEHVLCWRQPSCQLHHQLLAPSTPWLADAAAFA